MTSKQVILFVGGLLFVHVFMWFVILRRVKAGLGALKSKVNERYARLDSSTITLGPQSALYRGADAKFGNVKGNGIIWLTVKGLYFEKLTGQKIEVDLGEIAQTTVETTFKGKGSFATGCRHLVVRTREGNRIGFLIKGAEEWSERINAR